MATHETPDLSKYIPGEETIMLVIKNLEAVQEYNDESNPPSLFIRGMMNDAIAGLNAALIRMRHAAK